MTTPLSMWHAREASPDEERREVLLLFAWELPSAADYGPAAQREERRKEKGGTGYDGVWAPIQGLDSQTDGYTTGGLRERSPV